MMEQIPMALASAGSAFLGALLGAVCARARRKKADADLEDRTNALEILASAHCRRLKALEDGQDVLDARLCDLQDEVKGSIKADTQEFCRGMDSVLQKMDAGKERKGCGRK